MNLQAAYLEITNLCNLNCVTCYNRSGLNLERKEISLERLKKIVETLTPYGCRSYSFAGGEPTLHSELMGIIDYIRSRPDIYFSFVTNGTVGSDALINCLNSCKNCGIQISLDGSCEKVNALTRGAGSFTKSMALIRALTTRNIHVAVKMVISRENIGDVEPFYRTAVANQCFPAYAFINRIGNGSDDWQSKNITPQEKLKVLRVLDALNAEFNMKVQLPICTSDCPLDDPDAAQSILIKVDGMIYPCQSLYGDRYAVCSAYDFSEAQYMNGMKRISDMVTARKTADYGCSRCIIKNQCHHGCMAYADYNSGAPLATDGECEFRKVQFLGYDWY